MSHPAAMAKSISQVVMSIVPPFIRERSCPATRPARPDEQHRQQRNRRDIAQQRSEQAQLPTGVSNRPESLRTTTTMPIDVVSSGLLAATTTHTSSIRLAAYSVAPMPTATPHDAAKQRGAPPRSGSGRAG
ncbi:MAG: hypothetical protein ACRDRK_01585 [Pseudonocardia sp.]